jgi:hypothetical protein
VALGLGSRYQESGTWWSSEWVSGSVRRVEEVGLCGCEKGGRE